MAKIYLKVFSVIKNEVKTDYYKVGNTIYEEKDAELTEYFRFGNLDYISI